MNKIKAIIVPGNGGDHPEDKWFPYVEKELDKLSVEVINVEFPDPMLARKEYWSPFLEELGADENTILIGHSSGAVATLRYAEQHQILGSVLVGVYTDHLGYESEKQSGYFDGEWKWKDIKKHQEWVMVFASTDDPHIPIDMPREVQKNLATEYYEFEDRGHFGQKEIPELVEALKGKI